MANGIVSLEQVLLWRHHVYNRLPSDRGLYRHRNILRHDTLKPLVDATTTPPDELSTWGHDCRLGVWLERDQCRGNGDGAAADGTAARLHQVPGALADQRQ